MQKKTIILGIGNPHFSDDAAGIRVAECFDGIVDTEILLATDFKVIDKLLGYERAIIVDGVKTGADPGTVIEFSVDDLFRAHSFSGTHNLSLPNAIKIGYDVFGDEMPSEIRIIGIEVLDADSVGNECTPPVEAAIPKAVLKIKGYLT